MNEYIPNSVDNRSSGSIVPNNSHGFSGRSTKIGSIHSNFNISIFIYEFNESFKASCHTL